MQFNKNKDKLWDVHFVPRGSATRWSRQLESGNFRTHRPWFRSTTPLFNKPSRIDEPNCALSFKFDLAWDSAAVGVISL